MGSGVKFFSFMWYCKMYFPGRHEVIESDAFGTQGAPSQRKAFPFLESLLSFTELDIGKVAVALRCISDDLESLDRERMTNAMVRLGALAEMHSFFACCIPSGSTFIPRVLRTTEGR